jgi:hypothetical protein
MKQKKQKTAATAALHELEIVRGSIGRYLGPTGSHKNEDMTKCGINHDDFNSVDMSVLKRYYKMVKKFHKQYGWFYDYKGKFISVEYDRRPGSQPSDKIEISENEYD